MLEEQVRQGNKEDWSVFGNLPHCPSAEADGFWWHDSIQGNEMWEAYFVENNSHPIRQWCLKHRPELLKAETKITFLQKISKHYFRLENNEDEYRLSIIDRQIYPRVWIDDFQDGATIIAESNENFENRIMMSDKDWIVRFSGTLEEVEKQFDEWNQ